MRDRDDELKEFFKSSPPQDEFDFDPEGWEKMHAVLKAEKKARRFRFFIYLNALLIVVGLSVTFLLFENGNSSGKSAGISKTQNPQSLQIEELQPDEKHKAEVPSNAKIATAQPAKISQPETSGPDLNTGKPANTRSTLTTESTELASNPYVKQLRAGRAEISLKRIFSPSEQNGMAKTQKEPNNLTEQAGKAETYLTKVPEKNQDRTPELNSAPDNQDPQSLKEASADQVLNNPANTSGDSAATIKKTDEQPADIKPLAAKKDSILSPVPLSKDSNALKSKPKKILSLEIGSDYLLGWKNAGKTEAKGFNPIFGLNYFNGITDKVGVSMGIQYTTVNNLKETSHTSTATRLKFGEEVDVTTISARKMHYLVVPLKLSYALNEKNIFCIGYNLAYLLDVKSDVKTYTKRFNQELNEEVRSSMGYKTGFSDFDGQIAFCYRRSIYKGFFINTEFFFGLKDVKENRVYNTEFFERNSGFKLSLSYNLFTK